MDTHSPRSPAAASDDAAIDPAHSSAHPEELPSLGEVASPRTVPDSDFDPPEGTRWLAGHVPDFVEPLTSRELDTARTQTRRLRADGWTPERKRLFLERLAGCGVVVEACEAAGMSASAAYKLAERDPLFAAGIEAAGMSASAAYKLAERDPLFAAGIEAARLIARGPLADEAHSRARNGVVERIYRDGAVVAERHRYDNRLTMSVLARLDARMDRAEETRAPHLRLLARWDQYLDALGEDRREEGQALLAGRQASAPAGAAEGDSESAGDRVLHVLHPVSGPARAPAEPRDPHDVWEDEAGWWTNYPPPPGFEGEEQGDYAEDEEYRRTLSPEEQAVVDAQCAEEDAEDLALAHAQRAAFFGTG